MAVAILTLAAGCGGSVGESDATPGYDDSADPLDTTPFSPARPGNASGATTLPDGFLGEETLPDEAADRTATTSLSTTTTTEVRAPQVPPLATVSSICGFEFTLVPFEYLSEESPERTQRLIVAFVEVLRRYSEVAPQRLQADLVGIFDTFTILRDILAANGWDARSSAYTTAVSDIIADAEQQDSLPARIGRVVAVEAELCA